MDELVGISFQPFLTLILSLGSATKYAFTILPGMLDIFEADIAGDIVEVADGERTIGIFGAVECAP